MGVREKGGPGREKDRKGPQEALFTPHCHFFFDVMFHKALCFQFIYLVKGLGAHQLLCDFSRCKEGSEQL